MFAAYQAHETLTSTSRIATSGQRTSLASSLTMLGFLALQHRALHALRVTAPFLISQLLYDRWIK